jgi:hypothetical protein
MRSSNTAVATVAALVAGLAVAHPALAHHSFAMYDQSTTRTMTGKLTRFIPGGNHAQLIFEVLDEAGKTVMDKNGKPTLWGMELGSAMAIARQGITVDSFPPGTILTVTVHPLRDGKPLGAVAGPVIKCGSMFPQGGCTEKTGQSMTAPAN